MKQTIKYTLIILATIFIAVLFYQLRMVIVLFVVSLALTATNRPLLTFLGQYRIPGFLAQLLIIITMLAILGGLYFLIGPQLIEEIQRWTNHTLIEYSTDYQVWSTGASWQQMIASRLPEPGNLGDYFLGANGELLWPTTINLTQILMNFFSNLFIVLMFSMYWAQDQNRLMRLWLSFLPVNRRILVRNAWLAVEQAVGRYLRHAVAVGLFAAFLLGIGYVLLGLPYPISIALVAFLSWFIPLIGFAGILIPVFLSALGVGWGTVIFAIAYTLLIVMVLKYWLEPKYFHPQRYSSFLIVFWIVILGGFLGLGGYIAGPIMAVVSQALWSQYIKNRSQRELDEIQVIDLRQRYKAVYERYAEIMGVTPNPQLDSLFDRLEHSLDQTEHLIGKDLSNRVKVGKI